MVGGGEITLTHILTNVQGRKNNPNPYPNIPTLPAEKLFFRNVLVISVAQLLYVHRGIRHLLHDVQFINFVNKD